MRFWSIRKAFWIFDEQTLKRNCFVSINASRARRGKRRRKEIMTLIVKSNIKKTIKELQKGNEEITSVTEEVGFALERKVEEILTDVIKRAKENKRRTLHARDL